MQDRAPAPAASMSACARCWWFRSCAGLHAAGGSGAAAAQFYARTRCRSWVSARSCGGHHGRLPGKSGRWQRQYPASQNAITARRAAFQQQVLSRVGSLPGVEAAGFTDYLPLARIAPGVHRYPKAPSAPTTWTRVLWFTSSRRVTCMPWVRACAAGTLLGATDRRDSR